MSWNLENFTHRKPHFGAVVEAIRAHEPDVVAVQELIGPVGLAVESLQALAHDTGLTCEVSDDMPALAESPVEFHTGLLWRSDRVRPSSAAGAWRGFGAPELTRAMAMLLFNVDGASTPFRIASYHATPFAPDARVQEAYRVLAAIYRGDDHPGMVLGDFNGISSSETYDVDPYPATDWFPERVHQLRTDVPAGKIVADRRADHVLTSPDLGQLTDAAIHLDAPWKPTTGHGPVDRHPYRRIDRGLVTPHVRPALLAYAVGEPAISDHRPILIDIDSSHLASIKTRSRPNH